MTILATTEIKHIDTVNEFGIEIDLDTILTEELESGLPCDINNGW